MSRGETTLEGQILAGLRGLLEQEATPLNTARNVALDDAMHLVRQAFAGSGSAPGPDLQFNNHDGEPNVTKDDEVRGIKAALNVLVSAIIEDRQTPRGDGTFRSVPFEELGNWTGAQLVTEGLIRSPKESAYGLGVRALGKRLNELGGGNLMLEVCEEVAGMDARWESSRASIIDHRWDGIGSGVA